MAVTVDASRRYGELRLAPAHEQVCQSSTASTQGSEVIYIWMPNSDVAAFLPREFRIRIKCVSECGKREFLPVSSTAEFCLEASLAGLAILEVQGNLSPESRASCNVMRFLFQISQRIQERIKLRSSLNREELLVSSRSGPGGYENILPDDFGAVNGTEGRWTVGRLLDEGTRAAREHGIENPTDLDRIYYGIDLEARIYVSRRGLDLTPDAARQSLRYAMFDVGPAETQIDDQLKLRVFQRLFDAMKKHLSDRTDGFNKWFFLNFDGIVKQISSRKKPDGEIPRTLVRQAILELTFDSWQSVGQTVSRFMDSVAQEIRPSLTDGEVRSWDVLYKCRTQLGDLPLIVLYEHFAVAIPSVQRIFLDPDDTVAWEMFHRVLQTHATMIVHRRSADRSDPPLIPIGELFKVAQTPALLDRAELSVPEIAQAFFKSQRFQCGCTSEFDWNVIVSDSNRNPETVEFEIDCERCGQSHQRVVGTAEFTQFGREYCRKYG